jgi:hypothetical protein
MERLSLWELYEGNLEGGLLYWRPRRLWKWTCFHKDLVLGNMGGRSFPRALERRLQFLFIRRTFMRNLRDK